MIFSRLAFLFLSFLQMLMSYLFYRFGGLVFLLEETSEIHPVNLLSSQGGNEDFSVTIGCFLFLVLGSLHAVRFKSKLNYLDMIIIFVTLSLQAIFLLMVEVGSFALTMKNDHGWILILWFSIYGILWAISLLYTFYLVSSKYKATT